MHKLLSVKTQYPLQKLNPVLIDDQLPLFSENIFGVVRHKFISDGEDAKSLYDSAKDVLTDCIYGKIATYKGVAYKGHNEDGVVVTPDKIIVLDGLGGIKGGKDAVKNISEQFMEKQNATLTINQIAEKAALSLAENKLRGAACLVSCSVRNGQKKNERIIKFNQFGDCNALLLKRQRLTGKTEIIMQTKDGLTDLQNNLKTERDLYRRKELIAKYEEIRHLVNSVIAADVEKDKLKSAMEKLTIRLDDEYEFFVIMYSDGWGDNITPQETANLFSVKDKKLNQLLNIDQLMGKASKIISVLNQVGEFSFFIKYATKLLLNMERRDPQQLITKYNFHLKETTDELGVESEKYIITPFAKKLKKTKSNFQKYVNQLKKRANEIEHQKEEFGQLIGEEVRGVKKTFLQTSKPDNISFFIGKII